MGRFAVIPARWASTRFPGKPLALLNGRPMVEHVYRRCQEARCFEHIVVATDDERVAAVVHSFGGEVQLTSPACASGTDRVAEVARAHADADVIINVQGDEPALPPQALAVLVKAFERADVRLATLVRKLEPEERANPNVVKVVLDQSGHALYFSRADIPFAREQTDLQRWAHVGLYGYHREVLLELAALPPTTLEKTEGLEQLRALGAGIRITCLPTEHRTRGVDVPEDVPDAEAALKKMGTGYFY